MQLLTLILLYFFATSGCGQTETEPEIGSLVRQKRQEHAAIGLVRTNDFDCVAFLADRADQAITPTNCVTKTVWFTTDKGLESFEVISQQTVAAGFSRLTFSKPVSPNYLKIERNYDGWDEKKSIGFFSVQAIIACCFAKNRFSRRSLLNMDRIFCESE